MKKLPFLLLTLIAMMSCSAPKNNTQQGEALLQIVNADGLSLAVYNHDSLSTYSGRGVQDLLMLTENEPERLNGAIVADKMVGKAAAALMISGGVKEVYTNLIATPAREMLQQAGVHVVTQEEVPLILNRDHSGQCPIDSRLNEAESVDECVAILRAM